MINILFKSNLGFVRVTAFIIVLLMIASLFIGGAQPGAVGLFPTPLDKLVHTMYFFVMTFLLARFARLPVLIVILSVIFVAVCDELHQFYLPGRQAGFDDLFADAIGVLLGVLVSKLIEKLVDQKQVND